METCKIVIMAIALSFSTISLIGFWTSKLNKFIKLSLTLMLLVIVLCFFFIYSVSPFTIEDETAFIGTIATIVSIPVAILMGWNIYTVIDFKESQKKFDIRIEDFKSDIVKWIEKQEKSQKEYTDKYMESQKEYIDKYIKYNEGLIGYIQANLYDTQKHYFNSYISYIISIASFYDGERKDKATEATGNLEYMIRTIYKEKDTGKSILIRDFEGLSEDELLKEKLDYLQFTELKPRINNISNAINLLYNNSYTLSLGKCTFTVYYSDVLVREQKFAVYVLLDNDMKLVENNVFDKYIIFRMATQDLQTLFKYIGVHTTSSQEKAEEITNELLNPNSTAC